MNFGYHDQDGLMTTDEKSEPDKYSLQLYLHLISSVETENKDIVEIGCGRGGGLSHIARNFPIASALGIDLNKRAVRFCNLHYKIDGLTFVRGEDQKLGLENNSCDIVINVESSHCYQNMTLFLKEVFRILRPGGYFRLTDFRYGHEM